MLPTISLFTILLSLAHGFLAQELLAVSGLDAEGSQFITNFPSYNLTKVTEDEWRHMATADFAKYAAIVIGDSYGGLPSIQFLDDTKNAWSPAVLGNIVVIGTDPVNHGEYALINSAVSFAASGTGTGFYLDLQRYYDGVDFADVTSLSYFGTFTVRGNLNCYNDAHIVASSPALGNLTDEDLSNWSCSIHEAFSTYPQTGVNGFQALAIANGVTGNGSQTYADNSTGLPYIISRGATPAGCGDGIWQPTFGEECDDGNTVNGDRCSASCKCESGLPLGNGTCASPPNSSTSSIPCTTSSLVPSTSCTKRCSPWYTGHGSPPPYEPPPHGLPASGPPPYGSHPTGHY